MGKVRREAHATAQVHLQLVRGLAPIIERLRDEGALRYLILVALIVKFPAR